MYKYACEYTTSHPNGVVTHGSTEPLLSVLDAHGIEIRDMFVVGFNPDCGSVTVATQERALEIKGALEPGYAVTIKPYDGDWEVEYTRRELDGSEPSRFVTGIVLKDGTVAMTDGRSAR